MPAKPITKEELVQTILDHRNAIMGNETLGASFIDLLLPLAGGITKIHGIDDDGNITVEITAPIELYIRDMSKKKMQMFMDLLNEITGQPSEQ